MSNVHRLPTGERPAAPRWHTTITYRTERGPLKVEHDHQEIEDLHTLIELGPSWHAIEQIVTVLAAGASITVEAAEKQ